MAHKFEETDQQIERFKVFGKSRNGSKIWRNRPKIWGKLSKIERFKVLDQKMRKQT